MAMPWEIWNSDNSSKNKVLGYKKGKILTEDSDEYMFIGIDLGQYLVFGGEIKIGFNVPVR